MKELEKVFCQSVACVGVLTLLAIAIFTSNLS